MAVKFATKEKAASKKKDMLVAEKSELAVKVDLLFELNSELAPYRPIEKKFDGVKKVLASEAASDKYPSGEPVVLEGEVGRVVFSAAADSMEVEDMQALIGALKEKIGYEGLLSLIKLNVGDVKKYLSEAEMEPFYKKVPGARRLQSITKVGD